MPEFRVECFVNAFTEVHATGEGKFTGFRVEFNRAIQVEFTGDRMTTVATVAAEYGYRGGKAFSGSFNIWSK